MTASAAVKHHPITIERADSAAPILFASGTLEVSIRAGSAITCNGTRVLFERDKPFAVAAIARPGSDFGLLLHGGDITFANLDDVRDPVAAGYFAGFHVAPGRHAGGTDGGIAGPAISPNSAWDIDHRPACPDPRGMVLVTMPDGRRVWVDAYLLGVDHLKHGTSRCGATIADGRDRPVRIDGNGPVDRLDYATAVAIYAHHGKRLLAAEEFFAAAYGVKERCSRDEEPAVTGAMDDGAERFISRHNLFDATGTMWQWGTDGHPDIPRASLFGGSWVNGSYAGSRYASLGHWAGASVEIVSARGASDHLHPE